jgi:F0F1-type ATP synthase membrane subunit b/b'
MFLAETSIQLVPDGTLLLHLLMVVVMVAVVNRTLLRPINKILEDRDKHILGRVDDAKEILKTREGQLAEYTSALRQARSDGYQLLERNELKLSKKRREG